MSILPFFTRGQIVAGFGRGSKQLGFPTANFPDEVTDSLPDHFPCGIYYGWANVDNGTVHKMVMSVGYNPFFHNTKKVMETHILHNFDRDLNGCLLKVCVVGYRRPEKDFNSIDCLKAAIQQDIDIAKTELDKSDYSILKHNQYFFT